MSSFAFAGSEVVYERESVKSDSEVLTTFKEMEIYTCLVFSEYCDGGQYVSIGVSFDGPDAACEQGRLFNDTKHNLDVLGN